MSLFEFWRRKKETGEELQRSRDKKLSPSDLKRLLGDSEVRGALGNSSVASLLPPVGSEVFRRFTDASKEENQRRHEAKEEVSQLKPSNQLRDGESLPFFYGTPLPELLNTPLEELDPYYQSQQTFLVLGKGNIIHRFNSGAACGLFSPSNSLRTCAIRVLLHPFFRFLVISTILVNCVFMTMKNPTKWSSIVELVFLAIYTLEMIVKMVSRGVCFGKFSFFRDPWNWLDVLVISTMFLLELVSSNKLLALSFVFRILKLLPLIPGMKSTVKALIQSGKQLAGVTMVTVLFLSIFAVVGQQFFMGRLRNRCTMWPVNITNVYSDNGTRGFDYHDYLRYSDSQYFLPGHLDSLLCGNRSDAGMCPHGFTCIRGFKNPNYGYTSFDWFGPSLLSMIRLMTHNFWDNLVMLTLRASGKAYLAVFLLVFFPGCFCLLCLIIAAVAMAIGNREKRILAKAQLQTKEYNQIQEALKTSDKEEQADCRTAIPETEDDGQEISKKQHSRVEGSEDSSCSRCLEVANFCLKWNCCGCWRWLKQHLYTFVTNPLFDLGIILCLIINIIIMAMEHYPMTASFESMLTTAELVFLFIFLVEMLLKVIAMDPYGYFKVGWNIFESIIVALGILELFIADGFGFLCCLWLLRVFRLARWWASFNIFLKLVWSSLSALRNLTLVLLIVVFMFTVLGMQLFKDDYEALVCRISADCTLPRWHMNDLFHTFLLVFRVLLGDWIETLWDCMEVSSHTMCLTFFMTLVIIGNLLILGLFLTLLLSGVLNLSEQTQKMNLKPSVVQTTRAFRGLLGWEKLDLSAADGKDKGRTDGLALDVVTSDQAVPESEDEQRHPEVLPVEHAEDHRGNTPEDCCYAGCYRCCPLLDLNKSQRLGRFWSNLRRTCLSIVQHRAFEAFIILIIVLSSAALIFEDIHLPQRRDLEMVVAIADLVFTFIFLVEMLLKWSALGLKRYFTDAWCWLDFLILSVSLACLATDLLGLSKLGAFICSLRALMPLRIINRIQGLKVVVQTFLRSLPSLFNAALVSLTIWLVFSIMGVNMFAGKFSYCFNETSEEYFLAEHVNNKTECYIVSESFSEVQWKTLALTFDNVGSGYLSLFVLAAAADWFDLMYSMTDSTQVEDQPVYENNLYVNLYIVLFKIAVFFTVIFIIRAMIRALQRDWSEGKPLFMTENQLISIKALKTRLSRKPQYPVPQGSCRVWLYKLVTSLWFEMFMVVVICLNMVALIADDDLRSVEMLHILHWSKFTFLIIFLAEFILKIIALGRHYFTSGRNILDFVVLLLLIAGFFLADFNERYFWSPALVPIFQLPLISKGIYLTPRTRGIRKLLWGIFMSLPAILNIILLFSVLTFSFSVFGMFNFAYVKRGAGIDDMQNFETFWSSLICLLLTSPSSSWYGLLLPIMQTAPDCDPVMENPGLAKQGDCGNPVVGVVFFTTFVTLSSLLLVYLYIAIILETFHLENSEELSDRDLTMFYNTWRKFDPDASRYIQYSDLSDFCSALKDPLRIPKPNSIRLIHMDLPLMHGDKIHCENVLLALYSQVFGDPAEVDSLKTRLEKKFMSNSPEVPCEPISSTLEKNQEEVAATVIQ
ncbi:sodium channel protein type 4 subunit alpha B-like [Halichoeres trimaculatus]|uniref:sodium channel protein type 4 subunit alpha B-like n=1 Tax=Halichoeres trimaculatus TaxID=147232 RepID=UPI003D9EFC1C